MFRPTGALSAPDAIAALHAAQNIDPSNVYDAEYIAAHPARYSDAEVAQAHATLDACYYGNLA